jgi:LacI family transcriptional regulator
VKKASFLSITDQIADRLRSEISAGRWTDLIPGKHQLAAELGVNHKSVENALRQLETAGILVSRGAGRCRKIAAHEARENRSLRIAILTNEGMPDRKQEFHIESVHALETAGHQVIYAPKSLKTLRFEVPKVAAMVEQTPADAWMVYAGSREVLRWFASRKIPAFAVFGHRSGLRIPGMSPDKPTSIRAATRHLIGLGHTRIVLLCRKLRRLPVPGISETVFLKTLAAHGCHVGEYNLPDWDDSEEGFHECLNKLFRVTPPTALIVDEADYFVAAMQFLLRRGLKVPEDVSLISTDNDPAFKRCHPPISHISWESRPVVRRILQWATNVSRGTPDFRQSTTASTFVAGGTTGPARH